METPLTQISDEFQEHIAEDPHLCNVIERNIVTLHRLNREAAKNRGIQDKAADLITIFSGRMSFIYVHVIWFGLWILLNTGKFHARIFDPYPYGLLTMIVSLEAIFLSTFVLISQNRLSADADRRANLDLQIGLLTEHEVTRILQMLDAIQDKLGIENDEDSDLADLEQGTKPEDVLKAIEDLTTQVEKRKWRKK